MRLKVDLIVAPTTAEVRAAKSATKTIPIVFYNVRDPVGWAGRQLGAARGKHHGLQHDQRVLAGKRLELLKETIPKLSRVAVLWDPKNLSSCKNGRKSNSRRENSDFSFIPWR